MGSVEGGRRDQSLEEKVGTEVVEGGRRELVPTTEAYKAEKPSQLPRTSKPLDKGA